MVANFSFMFFPLVIFTIALQNSGESVDLSGMVGTLSTTSSAKTVFSQASTYWGEFCRGHKDQNSKCFCGFGSYQTLDKGFVASFVFFANEPVPCSGCDRKDLALESGMRAAAMWASQLLSHLRYLRLLDWEHGKVAWGHLLWLRHFEIRRWSS